MPASPLAAKMQFKPGQAILPLNAPVAFLRAVEPLPDGAHLVADAPQPVDAVVLFVRDSSELNTLAPPAMGAVKPGGMLWIAYPKGGSGLKTDLTRDAGWAVVFEAGFQPVRQVAVDATWSALRFKPGGTAAGEDPLAAHFSGDKAALRPVYDRIAAVITGLGPDVTRGVRQSYIGYARHQQFAVVKVAGRPPRIELGLRLPGTAAGGRLEPASKRFGAESATHVVKLCGVDEVDAEVAGWLAAAYGAAG